MFSRTRFFSFGLALVLLSIVSVTGLAQQTQNPASNQAPGVNNQRPGRAGRRGPERGHFGPRIMSQLNLTDDQRKSLRAATEPTVKGGKGEREELRQLAEKRRQGTLSVEDQARAKALRQQMRAAMAENQTKIDGILTTEQKAKAEQLFKERKAKKLERFGGRRNRMPGQPLGGDPVMANPTKKP